MTAREDRDWKNKNNFGERRMNMLCECLHQDPAHRVFTFGPSPVAASPSFISSPSIRRIKRKIQNHFVCFHLLTILRNKTYIGSSHGCYIWIQPTGYLQEIEKVKAQKKSKVGLLDLKKSFIYKCHHCNFD